MSLHRSSIQDTVVQPPVTTTHHNDSESEPTTTPPTTTGPADPSRTRRHSRWPMRAVVALSLFVGLAAAAAGVAVSAGGTEPVVDGLVLLGFAAGWAFLLGLSVYFTDHPQTWAAVPAAVMGVGGAALLVFTPSNATMDALGWVWPPALLGLLVWITTQIRRQLPQPRRPVDALPGHRGHRRRRGRRQYPHRHAVHRPGNRRSRCPGSSSTWATTGCTCPAADPVSPPSFSSRASGERRQPGDGSNPPSPHTPGSACTTGPAAAAATRAHLAGRRPDRHRPAHPAGTRGVTGPLVMVGHSLGGLYVLDYAARYPAAGGRDGAAGRHPTHRVHLATGVPGHLRHVHPRDRVVPGPRPPRRHPAGQRLGDAELPAQARDQVRADLSTAGQARSERDELAMVPTMMAQAGAVTDLGGLPLYVLTAPVDAQTGWLTPQMDLAALSRQQRPPGRCRRQPPITARQPSRRRRCEPGNHPGCRRRPDRHSPEVNEGATRCRPRRRRSTPSNAEQLTPQGTRS